MTNRFYIQQASLAGGLEGLAEKFESRVEFERSKAEETRKQQKRQEAAGLIQAGDPGAISDFMIKNPDIREDMEKVISHKDEATRQKKIESLQRIVIGGESPSQVSIEHGEYLQSKGADATETLQFAEQAQVDPEGQRRKAAAGWAAMDPEGYTAWRKATGAEEGAEDKFAGIEEFKFLAEGLTGDELSQARRIKLGLSPRATEGAVVKGAKAFATEAGKLEARFKLEPRVAGAVVSSKLQAAAQVKEAGTQKSNKLAWSVYDGAMRNLAQSMGGAATGPFVGIVPAITTNAQIADGSVALMAPVLKQLFRASGEGVFTDKDQDLLMQMVPSRTDTPGARNAKIAAIDALLRTKLGVDETAQPVAAPEYAEEQTATGPGGQKMIFINGNWEVKNGQ